MGMAQKAESILFDATLPEESAMTTLEGAYEATEAAFSDLLEEHSQMAYNIALRMLRNPTDAEDAVQEAFISAYRAFPKFKGQSKVSTWLYRIVVNACLMKIRKEKSRAKYLTQTAYDDELVHEWPSAGSWNEPERAALNGELRDALDNGLDRLSPEIRATVVLRDVQGFTTEEAATTLDISVPSLKARLHRGRVLLRKHLEGYLAQAA